MLINGYSGCLVVPPCAWWSRQLSPLARSGRLGRRNRLCTSYQRGSGQQRAAVGCLASGPTANSALGSSRRPLSRLRGFETSRCEVPWRTERSCPALPCTRRRRCRRPAVPSAVPAPRLLLLCFGHDAALSVLTHWAVELWPHCCNDAPQGLIPFAQPRWMRGDTKIPPYRPVCRPKHTKPNSAIQHFQTRNGNYQTHWALGKLHLFVFRLLQLY